MKLITCLKSNYLILFLSISLVCSCQPSASDGNKSAIKNNTPAENRNLSEEFKEYWYSGKAEISSYELTQYRYGEPRQGKAVLIFVSEDFNPKLQVKADNPTEESVSVLKLNKTKDFATGIYPYHIMESTFSPITKKAHAIKTAASVHEWCGQAYMQINNRDKLNVKIHTYFESTADQELQLDEALMENEVWNLLRIDPTAELLDVEKMIPSLEYLRLRHREAKAYPVDIAQRSTEDTLTTTFDYTTLNRTLKIKQEAEFPYQILDWQESITENGETKTTSAKRLEAIRSAYWNQNKPEFSRLRDSLQLPQYGK
jgi:hypothetical protein